MVDVAQNQGLVVNPTSAIDRLNALPLKTYNGNQYQLTSARQSWQAAQAEAVALGGNLVTINNAEEEAWIKQTFGSREGLWIGLNDAAVEGQFQWVSGETSTYRNWSSPQQPDNYTFRGQSPEGEDYAQMNWNGGRWNDLPNSYGGLLRGVVEIAKPAAGTPGAFALSAGSYSVNEAAGTVSIEIVRSGGSTGAVSIDYNTVNKTATAGSDYTTTAGRLNFVSGETSKRFTIPILNDTIVEGNETFAVTIDNPQGGATLLAPRTAEVTIVDDETAPNFTGYWKFNETTIGPFTDSSGRGLTATPVNLTAGSAGPSSNAPTLATDNPSSLKFDGVDDYVTVSDPASFLATGAFTQVAWINSQSTDAAFHGILGYQPDSGVTNRAPGMWVYEGTKLHRGCA
jgi:hypothetical protein